MPSASQGNDAFPHDVIESIVTLTEQRDQRSLEHSLYTSLQEMLDPDACWLLSLDEGEAAPRVVAGDAEHLPAGLAPVAEAVPDDGAWHQVQAGGREILIARTLGAEAQKGRMLALARTRWDGGSMRLARGMLKVYQNFVDILRDSEKDTLTGLYNRRKLENKLNDLLSATLHGRRYKDQSHADFLAVLDLDHFKAINDTHGHLIGDETLLAFANILRRTLRDDDLIFRFGGEEFVVLLQEVSVDQAGMVLERVRRSVGHHDFAQVGQVTVSIGYTMLRPGATPPKAIEEADRALYYAKAHGRDRVCDHAALVASGALRVPPDQGSVELF